MLHLLIASIVWAFSFGLIKHVLVDPGLDPTFVAFVRLGLSLLVFLPWLRLKRLDTRTALKLAGIGAVQYGLMYLAYLHAFRYLLAHQVALFTITTPILVTLIYDAGARRFHGVALFAAVASVAGAAAVMGTAEPRGAVVGFLAVQASNACFAFGQVMYRRVMPRTGAGDRDVFAVLYFGGAVVAALPLLFAWHPGAFRVSPPQTLTLLYLGVVASGVGFFLWNVGARRAHAGTLAVMNNAKIPLSVLVALVVFRESADWTRLLLGASLMGLAVALNESVAWRRRAAEAATPT